jgi:hypothetical protein
LTEAMQQEYVDAHPAREEEVAWQTLVDSTGAYSDEESAEIEARLKGLGYVA